LKELESGGVGLIRSVIVDRRAATKRKHGCKAAVRRFIRSLQDVFVISVPVIFQTALKLEVKQRKYVLVSFLAGDRKDLDGHERPTGRSGRGGAKGTSCIEAQNEVCDRVHARRVKSLKPQTYGLSFKDEVPVIILNRESESHQDFRVESANNRGSARGEGPRIAGIAVMQRAIRV
jgi:hypothetical protein